MTSEDLMMIFKEDKPQAVSPADTPLKIVEVQTGSYLEEDDIRRFDDDFQR